MSGSGGMSSFESRSGAAAPKSKAKPWSSMSETEKKLRIDLAAAYRLAHLFGWDEIIYNHITVRMPETPGQPERFLINPYGVGFDEVTPTGLVTIDVDGNVVDPGTQTGRVNAAGFLIHSTVHTARHDAVCVMHSHAEEVVAVGSTPRGLLPLSQASAALGLVTYHEWEGIAIDDAERVTITRDLGKRSKVMILRNHGALVLGGSVGEAFVTHFFLVRACRHQLAASSMVGDPKGLHLPSKEAMEKAKIQAASFNKEGAGQLEFEYWKRKLGPDFSQPGKFIARV